MAGVNFKSGNWNQFLVDPIDAVLTVPQQYHVPGLAMRNLPAQLRTDGAACAGDQHDFAVEVECVVCLECGPDHAAADPRSVRPDLADLDPAVQEFVHTGNGLECDGKIRISP